VDDTTYQELATKLHSSVERADKKKGQLINPDELAAIQVTNEQLAQALEHAAELNDWLVFELLVIKAQQMAQNQTLVPSNSQVPKPKRRWRSYLITTKQDWTIKDVPRARYERPQEPVAWVPVLCKVLDTRHDDINNENIVDALDLPADSRALPSLVRVLNDYPKWPASDSNGGMAIKTIWAISRIDTPAAIQALRTASTNPQILEAPYSDDVLRALQDALRDIDHQSDN
jgi:hypothetical protein